jgi:CubicO group peptidase (beta-lactamase class C family)
LKDRDALEQITVKMLLNHTSGIDGTALRDHEHDEETIEGGIRRLSTLGQIHRPGQEFSYCNAATVIAGYLVQRLTGKSWYRLIRERLFEPLGMEDAATLPEEALLHRASVGHYLDPKSDTVVRTSRAFNALSRAPAGTTLMMSARDLVQFARTHMALGVGVNGTRVLSERSARAMQEITIDNSAKGYTLDVSMGLGWMVTNDGLLLHTGAAPGATSALYVHPGRRWAAAILTNAAHGVALINDLIEPWLKEINVSTKPLGIMDAGLSSARRRTDAGKYVGVYEDVLQRHEVCANRDLLTLSSQWKYAYNEHWPTEPTPPQPLVAKGNDQFILQPVHREQPDASRDFAAARVFAFRSPGVDGRMTLLGNLFRLYSRVS